MTLLSLAAGSAGGTQGATTDDLFTQIYNRTAARKQTLQSIRARFTETTVSSLLERPLIAHGTVTAAPPARVLMVYTDPEVKRVVLDGKTLWVVWPDRKQQERFDIAQMQKRIDRYFTQASPDQLRSLFEITAETDTAGPGVDRITMRPKRGQIKEGLQRLVLWIDRQSLLLTQMQMTFPGGDTKMITLDEVVVNVPVTEETFRIRP